VASDKHVFLWRPAKGESIARFAHDALARIDRATAHLGERVVHLTEEEPPRLNVVPYRREPLAMIALTAPVTECIEALTTLGGTLAGYRVEESVPVARAPGRPAEATLLTLFRKNRGLDRAAFFDEWYGTHTPLSLEIHPIVGYVRNAVEAGVVGGSPAWDGIVTEDFATRADLLDARRLFGGTSRMIPNMIRVGRHVARFLDLRTIETYFVRERRLP
jgi:hypothetical protein